MDDIHDEVPAIAEMWQSYGIEHVLICKSSVQNLPSVAQVTETKSDNWPDVFTGYGKNGTAGDSLNNSNYNWTQVLYNAIPGMCISDDCRPISTSNS